jgi:predicted Zn-dependent peptidase
VLAELLQPVLDAEDFEQERNVILEEIARYEDIPSHILFSRFLEDYFRDHPLSRETLGTPDTIRSLTVDEMREYWKRRYGTRNLIFAIAGNFEWDAIVEQVSSLTETWEEGETGRLEAPAPFVPGFHVHEFDKFSQEQIAIGVPSVSAKDPRYFTAAVLATILGDDTGSRLFWALQQTGLAESAVAQITEFDDNGVLMVNLSTEPALAAEALEAVRLELRRLQEFDITPDELERAKAKLNSSVVIAGESSNERVMGLIRSWLTQGRLETLEDIRHKIEAVQLPDLKSLIVALPVFPELVVTAVGPLAAETFGK